jgi:hypothetical protein
MNKSIEFLNEYCDFSDSNCVWVLKGLSRNKDNPDNHYMHKFLRRLIITKPEDIQECYDEIHFLANNSDTKYRIYISLNSRNIFDATFGFQKKMVDIASGLAKGHPDALEQSKKLSSVWKTCLEQRYARGTKRILLDVDNLFEEPLQIISFINQHMETKLRCCKRTVSGWAIVFDACDTRELIRLCKEEWNLEVDLQRDSMLFVEQF